MSRYATGQEVYGVKGGGKWIGSMSDSYKIQSYQASLAEVPWSSKAGSGLPRVVRHLAR